MANSSGGILSQSPEFLGVEAGGGATIAVVVLIGIGIYFLVNSDWWNNLLDKLNNLGKQVKCQVKCTLSPNPVCTCTIVKDSGTTSGGLEWVKLSGGALGIMSPGGQGYNTYALSAPVNSSGQSLQTLLSQGWTYQQIACTIAGGY